MRREGGGGGRVEEAGVSLNAGVQHPRRAGGEDLFALQRSFLCICYARSTSLELLLYELVKRC